MGGGDDVSALPKGVGTVAALHQDEGIGGAGSSVVGLAALFVFCPASAGTGGVGGWFFHGGIVA